jgi:hypothetical protein
LPRVRIAGIHDPLRQAVEGQQQVAAVAMPLPVRADRRRDRGDPARVEVVVAQQVQGCVVLPGHVGNRFGGGGGVLRVQRQHQGAAATAAQASQRLRQRRRAVAHGPGDVDTRQPRLHRCRQLAGVHRQRRAAGQPDGGVLACHPRGTPWQDHEVEQRQPQPARQRDHAPVGEEFAQVTAHCRRGRRLRRSEVDQQHGVGVAHPA